MTAAAPTDPAPRHAAAWPPGVPWTLPPADQTLWQALAATAARVPDKPAFVFFGRTLTFAELHDQAERLAGWLRAQGVARGDRVILYLQNSPQFAIAFYGILRADAVVVPVNPMNKMEELGHYIVDPGVRVAIAADDIAPMMAAASDALPAPARLKAMLVAHYADHFDLDGAGEDGPPPSQRDWLAATPPMPLLAGGNAIAWRDALGHPPIAEPATARPDDLAVLPYTSGTTGLPKGCLHTHRTLMHNVLAGEVWNGLHPDAVMLGVVPMFHITGLQMVMNIGVHAGLTTVLMPRWDRAAAARAISRWRVTHWTNIPTMVIDLIAMPGIEQVDLSSLRYIGGGGAAMPAAVAERLQTLFGLRYVEGYGLTETAAPTHSNPAHAPKLHCLGIPFVGTRAIVVDPQTLTELPPGQQGEILVAGPQVFKGYWNQPMATDSAFVEIAGTRWFRTGDLGHVDDDGYFFITDRLKRMINSSGFKVWPAEVEAMMYRHPAVQEACVIAARDDYRGETPKAVIVLRPEARGKVTPDEIIDWAKGHMAAYKYPRIVEFVDTLPRSGSGKLLWRMVQASEDAKTPRA